MALFGFKKKKEEKESCGCACSCGCASVVGTKPDCGCPAKDSTGASSVKVLGAGCAACHKQYEYVKEAVKNMGLSAEVEYITDMKKIMEYGVMGMPAIVVNEKVVAMSRVLKTAEVEDLLRKAGF